MISARTGSFHPENPKGLSINFLNLVTHDSKPLGKRGGVSLILVQTARDILLSGSQQDRCTNWTSAHEIGHILFGLHYQENYPLEHSSGGNFLMHDLEIENGQVNEMRYMQRTNIQPLSGERDKVERILSMILLVSMLSLTSDTAAGMLRVRYEVSKTSYVTAEPIFVVGWFENMGTKSADYNLQELWDLNLVDSDGRKVRFGGRESMPHHLSARDGSADNGPTLESGAQSTKTKKCITDDYGNGQGGFDLYLPAGDYLLSNTLHPSDTIRLSVADPTESELLAAVRLLTGALDKTYELLGTSAQRLKFYGEFYDKFPNTVYAQRALMNLISLSPLYAPGYDEERRQHYIREMLILSPPTDFNYMAIDDLDVSYTPLSERNELAHSLRLLSEQVFNPERRSRVLDMAKELERQ